MADHAKIAEVVGAALKAIRKHEYNLKEFDGYFNQVFAVPENVATTADVYNVELTGMKFNNTTSDNTDTAGEMWLKSTAPDGSNISIQIYSTSAASAGVLVASGVGTGTGTQEITITAENSSGLNGFITIASYASNDVFRLVPRWNIKDLVDDIDTTISGDFDASSDISNAIAAIKVDAGVSASSIKSMKTAAINTLKNNIVKTFVAKNVDSGSRVSGTLLSKTNEGTGGAVSYKYSGIVKDWDDSIDSASQYLTNNTVSFGALTQVDSTDQGRLTATTKTPSQYVYDEDVIWIECTKTLDATTEEFSVKSEKVGNAELPVRLGQSYQSPKLGIKTLLLDRTIEDAGSAASYTSAYTISGETSTYVPTTTLYVDVSSNSGTLTVDVYNAAAKGTGDKIMTGSRTGTGTVTLTAYGSSGCTGTCEIHTAPPAGPVAGTLDLNINQVGDNYYFSVSNNTTGIFATELGRIFEYEFTSSGGTAYDEDFARIYIDRMLRGR